MGKKQLIVRTNYLLLLACFGFLSSVSAQPVRIIDPSDTPPISSEDRSSKIRPLSDHILDIGSFTVDNSNREEVRVFFNALYWASQYATIDWTGSYTPWPGGGVHDESVVSPLAGDTSDLFKEAVLLRVNFYRAMAGIPADIILLDTLNHAAQLSALIQGGNNNLSHDPIGVFLNYLSNEGDVAAGESNIAIGSYGPDSIDGYMQDKGASNLFVGHRRWILYPPATEMGTGDIPASDIPAEAQANIPGNPTSVRRANSLHVFSDNNFPPTSPFPVTDFEYVAFPQEGYVPYHVVHPRWSFAIDGANFSGASVTMTRDGESISAPLETYGTGFGSNTLVWRYDGIDATDSHTHPKPDNDVTYQVTVSGITGALQSSYTYDVIVFDPEVPTSGEATVTSVSGPAEVEMGVASNFDVALPAFAILETNTNVTGIRYRSFTTASGDSTEDAESGIGSLIARTTGDYEVVLSSVGVGGSSAFHLATGELNTTSTITFPDAFVMGGSSSLSFASKVGFATETQIAKVNVSLDNGVSWLNVFAQPGNNAQEGSYSTKMVDLSAYSGRTIHLQFEFEHTGGSGFLPQTPTDSIVGWLIDNITLTGVESMNSITTSSFMPSANSFSFTASSLGDISLQAQGMLHDDYEMEWGTVLTVTAVAAAETVTANDDSASIDEGSASVNGNVLTNDDKPAGETLTVDQVNGSDSNVGVEIATTYGTVTISANGDFTYTLDNANTDVQSLDDGESLEDTATYRAIDGESRTDTATLRITINGRSITAEDDNDDIDEGDDYTKGSLLGNDIGPDGETVTVTQVDGDPENVGKRIATDYGYIVIAPDGSYAYQVDNDNPDVSSLNDGETLQETFTYRLETSQGDSAVASLQIVINGSTTTDPGGSSRVTNISTRSEVLTGGSVMIAGFTVAGSEPLDVLIRAVGPTLGSPPHNVPGVLPDPSIHLFKTDFTVNPPAPFSVDIPQNPNSVWGGDQDIMDAMALVGAFEMATDSVDAAMVTDLTDGVYTAIVSGVDEATGIGLVEVYATSSAVDARLTNISTRAFVGSEEASLIIAGFTVIGNAPQKVLIRAKSTDLGLAPEETLPDPKIKVWDQTAFPFTLLHENDDWGEAGNNTAEVLLVAGAVGSVGYTVGSSNSAIVVDLAPNRIYGVHLDGAPGTSGVALVEVFAAGD